MKVHYWVQGIPSKMGKELIRKHHYSHSCHNGPTCFGLWRMATEPVGVGERFVSKCVGVIAFATPCSENVRASVFGPDLKDCVTELHRMWIDDDQEHGIASRFISQAIKQLRDKNPMIRGIISFADTTEGHRGTVYQAANFMYCGTTGKATFYRDERGALRHPRQNGVNITKDMAAERGWKPERRDAKHRYFYLAAKGGARKWFMDRLRLTTEPYPPPLGRMSSGEPPR